MSLEAFQVVGVGKGNQLQKHYSLLSNDFEIKLTNDNGT